MVSVGIGSLRRDADIAYSSRQKRKLPSSLGVFLLHKSIVEYSLISQLNLIKTGAGFSSL